MKDQEKAKKIIEKYSKGLCTPEEKAWVEAGFVNDLRNTTVEVSEAEIEAVHSRMYTNLQASIGRATPLNEKRMPAWQLAVAASVILVMGCWLYFYMPQGAKNPKQQTAAISVPRPGGDKALLTLADGRKISLTGSTARKLAEQSGIGVHLTADGQIIYKPSEMDGSLGISENAYNTIATPRAGQYRVILPDETRVWINSGSSIRFPVAFTSKSRTVEITGEVYFEVAKDAKRPFKVISDHQTVTVLGTHFNVNTYQDDGLVRTTLIEGSVLVQSGKQQRMLSPGEQSTVSQVSGIQAIRTVQLDEVVAWKNGDFIFRNAPLVDVTQKLARWYDVDFVLNENLGYRFNGKISRKKSLTAVLKMMEITSGAKFKIEGRRVFMEK